MEMRYDIVVVGAGHAGCEAAGAAGNLGARVLLITMDMTKIAQMSCNPAMGGVAKGQIIREIDALGGISGIVTDTTRIQFRMLNRSKGPAVWSPRAQCDRMLFSLTWRKILEENKNVDIWQDQVTGLLCDKNKVYGVVTQGGMKFHSRCVVLTVGTFGNGLIHMGRINFKGGRIAEPISTGITEQLREAGIKTGRMKTGTPARLDGRTINFKVLEKQEGDGTPQRFSFLETRVKEKQLPCFITFTNAKVHSILEKGFNDSPLYNGTIKGIGPRYCPSIEDKIVTFKERERHQLFLEPEGWKTVEYYLNGFSSSLPVGVQYEAIREIPGLSEVKLFRPGYAIEYDYYLPTQLFPYLESKKLESLFMAGQINGTTGYEEAAAQGLMAGINAYRKINDQEPVVLGRDEAYIGVLIDDLVTKGVDEPYRMFTSRAEYRVLLRQDNADMRLTGKAIDIGLAKGERRIVYERKEKEKRALVAYIEKTSAEPVRVNDWLREEGTNPIEQKVKLLDLLLRPEIGIRDLIEKGLLPLDTICPQSFYRDELIQAVEVELKYRGYISRERLLAEKAKRLEGIAIENGIDYNELMSISTEGRQKLARNRPTTIGQASRIPGISPSDINVLLLYMGR